MASSGSTRAVVRQLLMLASDADNREFICKQKGCVSGLVGYIDPDSRDLDIKLMAMQTLLFLSSEQANKAQLAGQAGLIDRVTAHATAGHLKLRELALGTLLNLGQFLDMDGANDENAPCNTNTSPSESAPAPAVAARKPTRSVQIKVSGLHAASLRRELEGRLIRVAGVISVTLDQRRGHAVVMTKLADADIRPQLDAAVAAAVAAVPEEDLLPAPAAPGTPGTPGTPARARGGPSYLDDDDDSDSDDEDGGAVSSFGHNSLEARLEARRREEEERRQKQRKVTRIMGKVGQGIGMGLSAIGLW